MLERFKSSDLQGLLRLGVHGATEVTTLVEEVHQAIAGPFGQPRAEPGRTGGIAGLVYRCIHAGLLLAGAGLAVAGALAPKHEEAPPSSPERDRMLAVMNGVIGDTLAASRNPLAIPMTLRSHGHDLRLERNRLRAALPHANGRLLILVHGLCMNDSQWVRVGHDHGRALAGEFGYTPLYLRYNSGVHISTNGRDLAALLETTVAQWPVPVQEIVLVGHSMGGLVARSACHYAALENHAWLGNLRKLVLLGAPHHGSPWERIGAWTGDLFNVSGYSAPFGRLGRLRSAGITDLRHGNIVDEDWSDGDRFVRGPDRRKVVPLPANVATFAAAATRGATDRDPLGRLLGDGLVPISSALGHHSDSQRTLAIPPAHQWVGYGMTHLDLLNRPEVYAKLQEWVAS